MASEQKYIRDNNKASQQLKRNTKSRIFRLAISLLSPSPPLGSVYCPSLAFVVVTLQTVNKINLFKNKLLWLKSFSMFSLLFPGVGAKRCALGRQRASVSAEITAPFVWRVLDERSSAVYATEPSTQSARFIRLASAPPLSLHYRASEISL